MADLLAIVSEISLSVAIILLQIESICSPLYSSSRPQKTADGLEFKYVISQNKLGWWRKLGRWLR